MPFEAPRAHKRGERMLVKAGYGGGIERELRAVAGHERVRQHQIADAQAGRQAFGEGVDIHHAACAIQLAQRGDGAGGIAELTVVIILDDVAVGRFRRPAKDFQSAGSRHNRAQWEMVRRRKVYHRCVTRGQRVSTQTVLVQRCRTHGHTVHCENLIQLAVAGVLERVHTVAAEQLNDKVHQILRACADEDVVRRDIDAAEVVQVAHDLLSKFRRATWVGRTEQCTRVFAQHTARQPRPCGERKAAVIDKIRAKIVRIGLLRGENRRQRRCKWLLRLGDWHGKLLLHKVAAPWRRGDVAFGGKLTVSGFHGDLADAQIGRQLAFARQARAAGQGAGHDVRADSVVELLVERLLVVRFEMVSQHGRMLLSLRLLQNLC